MSYDEHLISMAGGDGQPEPLDLAAIQARADAATEGPWETMRAGLLGTRVVHVDGEWEGIVPAEFITMVTPALKKFDDALFMAHARTDVPALLAYARDLEARVGRVEAEAYQLCAEAQASENVAVEVRKEPRTEAIRWEILAHEQHAKIARNHATRFLAALNATEGA